MSIITEHLNEVHEEEVAEAIERTKKEMTNKLNEVPNYKFALREDLLDCPQFIPTRAEPSATGWDVRAAQADRAPIIVKPGDFFKIPLGFRSFCPPGWWLQLNPRSSSFTKKKMRNLIGIIDEQYPQELLFAGQYCPEPDLYQPRSSWNDDGYVSSNISNYLVINFGDAIGQIIPVKRIEMKVEIISNEEFNKINEQRSGVRKGGFGSSNV
jgi:dUTPase